MKTKFSTLFVAGMIFFSACNAPKSDNTQNADMGTGDTSIVQNPTQVEKDSTILSDDSATVKTVKDVKLEEKNAVGQEKAEAQKLEADKKKDQ